MQKIYYDVNGWGTIHPAYKYNTKVKLNIMARSKWEFYEDKAEEWRWRKIAPNNKVVGASSEGFSSKANAIKNAKLNGYQGA